MKHRDRRDESGLALCLALTIPFGAAAQVVPSSGELLQQAPHPAPPIPSSDPGLTVQQPPPSGLPDTEPFFVARIEITGNTLLPQSELRALTAGFEGKMLSLFYLKNLADRITQLYQDRGYLLSRAYVPAQTLREGTVRIAVLEARYGGNSVTNTSRVPDSLLRSYLLPLEPGLAVTEAALERSLLLLSDVPGTVVNSTLSPGGVLGATDLEISATPGASYGGSVGLDDAGNRYTGRARLSSAVNFNNPLKLGDVLALNGMTAGPDLTYGRIGYQSLLENGRGTTLGAALSGLYYHLGNGLSDLHGQGTAEVESLTAMQPLIRTVAGNLFAQFSFDAKQLRDEIDVTDIHTDRRTDAFTATLAGDRRDAHGISNMSLGVGLGHLDFDNAAAELRDASSARTRGSYVRYTLSLARLQSLSDSNSVYVAVNGQGASKNLDPSEQFFLGGPNSVRAYDVGTLGGAEGALATAEFRHNFGVPFYGAWQAIAFVDSGAVQVYRDTYAPGDNHATLSGAGLGLNWTGAKGWTAALGVARPIGSVPALAGHAESVRVWGEIHKSL